MATELDYAESSDELYLAILQGPEASGKSTIARGLQLLGFETIGLGALYRGIDSLYITKFPDQVDRFCAEQFGAFMADEADAVRAILRGEVPSPHADLKHPDIQASVSHVGETEVAQVAVNDRALELLSGMRGLVFMEGRALDQVLRERAAAAQFSGTIVANFFVDVSDEMALERNLLDAEDKGIVLNPEEELARIKERNERDRTRAVNPMVLPELRIAIDSPINAPMARQIGARAFGRSKLQGDLIPICTHIQTDGLFSYQTREISQNVTLGGLTIAAPYLMNRPVSARM